MGWLCCLIGVCVGGSMGRLCGGIVCCVGSVCCLWSSVRC